MNAHLSGLKFPPYKNDHEFHHNLLKLGNKELSLMDSMVRHKSGEKHPMFYKDFDTDLDMEHMRRSKILDHTHSGVSMARFFREELHKGRGFGSFMTSAGKKGATAAEKVYNAAKTVGKKAIAVGADILMDEKKRTALFETVKSGIDLVQKFSGNNQATEEDEKRPELDDDTSDFEGGALPEEQKQAAPQKPLKRVLIRTKMML